MKKEEVDAAFLGSFTGALAISQLNVVPLARPINTDGTSTYYGQIFVRKESDIKSALDMKEESLALGTLAGGVAHDFNNILVPRFMAELPIKRFM